MMRRLIGVLLLALPLWPATITVCSSGCTYTAVQAAINAANPGDIIEITAGQTFEEYLFLPWKAGSDWITVRSSRWRELPPPGYRVNPTDHGALMPTIQGPGTSAPVLRAGQDEQRISQNGVNTSTDVISGPTWTDGTAITVGVGASGTLPAPLQRGVTYYVRDAAGSTFKLAASPGGAAIDLTTVGSAAESYYYSRPWTVRALNAHHWRFIGIDFRIKNGVAETWSIIHIGWDETAINSVPRYIEFERVLIRGNQDDDGPNNGLNMNGAHLVLRDSWVDHVKRDSGIESHGILMVNTPGPVLIENNFIAAASIGIMTGGQGSSVHEKVATNATIRGNHIVKRGYMLYNQGSGAPSGACYYGNGSGRFYRNTTPDPNTCANGACYVCQSNGTWEQDAGATYRNLHYLTKGGIEFKGCEGCLVEGNVIEGVFAAHDPGNVSCLGMGQISNGTLYNYIGNTVLRNNWCKDTWGGLYAVTDGEAYSAWNHNVVFDNNLITGMANYPAMSIHANANDSYPRPMNLSNGATGMVFSHNTFRAATGMSYTAQWGLVLMNNSGNPTPLTGSYLLNSIAQGGSYGVLMDGDYTCASTGFGKWFGTSTSPKYVANTIIYDMGGNPTGSTCNPSQNFITDTLANVAFVSSTNHRLQPTSKYSASCQSGCAFAGTDGKDLGADIDQLEAAISGAVAGTPDWATAMRLKVAPGSTRAVVSYLAPSASSCTLKVYTNMGRTTLHGDTDTVGEQADTRTGNVTEARRRQFALGTNTALAASTEYWAVLTCGSQVVPFSFRTFPAGQSSREFLYEHASARTMRHSASADMSDPTDLGSATSHTVVVSAGEVRYAQPGTTGPIDVLLAP